MWFTHPTSVLRRADRMSSLGWRCWPVLTWRNKEQYNIIYTVVIGVKRDELYTLVALTWTTKSSRHAVNTSAIVIAGYMSPPTFGRETSAIGRGTMTRRKTVKLGLPEITMCVCVFRSTPRNLCMDGANSSDAAVCFDLCAQDTSGGRIYARTADGPWYRTYMAFSRCLHETRVGAYCNIILVHNIIDRIEFASETWTLGES